MQTLGPVLPLRPKCSQSRRFYFMAGKVGFRIFPDWERPSEALLAKFAAAASPQVGDVMYRLGMMDTGIRPMWPSPKVIGPALTVWVRSADNLMMHKALSLAKPGDIMVVNTQGNMINAGFGELMATTAVAVGIKAVIIDGVVRDVAALQALGLPTYARGLNPTGCDKDGPGEIGSIISCGGAVVRPGDILVADEDGVTVVALADAEVVAEMAQAKVRQEEKRIAEIKAGQLFKAEIDETLRRNGVI
jgi:4-hydroxy-4-methyl-2-oxoglutarate aldolase